MYREEPFRSHTFTEVRKSHMGDVAFLYKLFLFLEHWGFIKFDTTPPSSHADEEYMEEEYCKICFKEGAPSRFSFWILNFKFRFDYIIVGSVILFYVVWNFCFWFLNYEFWFQICNTWACEFDFLISMAFLFFLDVFRFQCEEPYLRIHHVWDLSQHGLLHCSPKSRHAHQLCEARFCWFCFSGESVCNFSMWKFCVTFRNMILWLILLLGVLCVLNKWSQ